MPNWCANQITICGDPAKIRSVLDAATFEGKTGVFSLKAIHPVPESLANVSSGSDETLYDVFYGKWEPVAKYHWVVERHGKVESRERLIEIFEEGKGDDIRAIADKYKHNVDTYGFKTWYDWCCRNWGTKWDIDGDYQYEDGEEILTFHCDSAWSPPVAAFEHISQLFPSLTFTLEYYEGGCDFMGLVGLKDGSIIRRDEGAPSNPDDLERFDFAPEPYDDEED